MALWIKLYHCFTQKKSRLVDSYVQDWYNLCENDIALALFKFTAISCVASSFKFSSVLMAKYLTELEG